MCGFLETVTDHDGHDAGSALVPDLGCVLKVHLQVQLQLLGETASTPI